MQKRLISIGSSLFFAFLLGGIAPGVSLSAPVLFEKTLSRGITDPEVGILQACLRKDPALYPEGLVTNFFGSLTQAAVEKFQIRHGIVSSGTPPTTGFGLVGPRTRLKLNMICGEGSLVPPVPPTPTTPTSPPSLPPAPLPTSLPSPPPPFYQSDDPTGEFPQGIIDAIAKEFQEYDKDSPLGFAGPGGCSTYNECVGFCGNPHNFVGCNKFGIDRRKE